MFGRRVSLLAVIATAACQPIALAETDVADDDQALMAFRAEDRFALIRGHTWEVLSTSGPPEAPPLVEIAERSGATPGLVLSAPQDAPIEVASIEWLVAIRPSDTADARLNADELCEFTLVSDANSVDTVPSDGCGSRKGAHPESVIQRGTHCPLDDVTRFRRRYEYRDGWTVTSTSFRVTGLLARVGVSRCSP